MGMESPKTAIQADDSCNALREQENIMCSHCLPALGRSLVSKSERPESFPVRRVK